MSRSIDLMTNHLLAAFFSHLYQSLFLDILSIPVVDVSVFPSFCYQI